MTELTLMRPAYLWCLIPLLAWFFVRLKQPLRQGWYQILPEEIARKFVGESTVKMRAPWLTTSLLTLLILALSGPSWQAQEPNLSRGGNARVLVMDMSMSMRATDVKPNRLQLARYKALDLLKYWRDGETALMAFAGDAYVLSPLSTDSATLANLLPHLSPEIMPILGSNLGMAIDKASQLLKQGGYEQGDIIIIGDGANDAQLKQLASAALNSPFRISILGVGSLHGAPIELTSGELLKDDRGQIVIPTLRMDLLDPICRNSGGACSQLTPDNQDIEHIGQLASQNHRMGISKMTPTSTQVRLHDHGYWLILPALLLCLLVFRRPELVLVVLLMNMPHAAKASIWTNQADQAHQSFKNQDYAEAARGFKTPQWQGSAWYRAGDYKKALNAFSQDDSATGWYNRGNALAKLGEYEKAEKAYDEALARDPKLTQAAQNKQRVEQAKEQQQQQQQQQQQNDNPSQDQQQGDASQSQQGGSKDQQGQNDKQDGSASQSSDPNQEQEQAQKQDGTNAQGDDEAKDPNDAANQKEQQAVGAKAKEDDSDSDPSAKGQAQLQGQDSDQTTDPALQKCLDSLPDDPSLLLRNKMRIEYQKNRSKTQPKETW
jgi:Ca-activated chloride channel family protein